MNTATPQPIDEIIHAGWVIPMDPARSVHTDHAIAIDAGKIIDIGEMDALQGKYQAATTTRLASHALIPGLINAHTHAAMSLMRGLADDLPLMTWLQEHIWPAEGQWVDHAFVREGTELAAAEMIRSGSTTFNDMYFFPDATAAVAAAAGMRATVGLIMLKFPTVWAGEWQEYIDKGLAVHDQYRADELINTAFAPHSLYAVDDEPLEKIRILADELAIPIHIHVHETRAEVEQHLADHGSRPLQHLDELGLLTPSLLAVHLTQLEDKEIARLAEGGAHVLHCPQSNMKLASGLCPLKKLQQAGVNVALGTDGAASNNDLDMLSEMQSAAMLAKVVSSDAAALPAHDALAMATINAAKALRIDAVTGSLEAGKAADITAIDLSEPETQPLYNPLSQIIYAADRRQVTDVWCNGKRLLKDRELQTLDVEKIKRAAVAWGKKLAG